MKARSSADYIRNISSFLAYVGAGALAIMVILMVGEVLARYILGSPIRGSFEVLSTYILPISVIFAMPYALRKGVVPRSVV